MPAGQAVNLANANQSILTVSSRIGDDYAWWKIVSTRYHAQLGLVNATMTATLVSLGMDTAGAQQVVQIVNNIDTLIGVVEGTSSSPYVARNMVPDLASVQGLTV